MPATKDNWQKCFALDSGGNIYLKTTAGAVGAGTAAVKDLDFGLEELVDNATSSFRTVAATP